MVQMGHKGSQKSRDHWGAIMLHRTAFATLLLFVCGSLAPSATAADVSVSAVDKVFAPWDTTRSPGMVVIRDGQFERDGSGHITDLRYSMPRIRRLRFARQGAKRADE
jgi:hypothetical protein